MTTLRLAYLVPTYPEPSQTFIGREIRAIEACGVEVHRFAIRSFKGRLVDGQDIAEAARTTAVLDLSVISITLAVAQCAMSTPMTWLRTLSSALRPLFSSEISLLRRCAYFAEACVLRRLLREADVGHLHVHFGTNASTVALLCRRLGGPPVSITMHGPEEFDLPTVLRLGRKVVEADAVVAISEFARSQLLRWTPPEHWNRVHVVRCGLDEQLLTAPVVPVPVAPALTAVGRLVEQKGQLVLLHAMARVVALVPDARLTIIGDGPMRDELETAVHELGLANNISLIGLQPASVVRQSIEASRALVMPSFAEGLPVVVMEALALHRPVVATQVAGIPELVRPGINGWLVSPGSVEELASALVEVLSASSTELDRMGAAGACRVAERHRASLEAQRLLEVLTGAANGSRQEAVGPCVG